MLNNEDFFPKCLQHRKLELFKEYHEEGEIWLEVTLLDGSVGVQ